MNDTGTLLGLFASKFDGRTPEFVVRAPGRVNLIGEHTDYNDGFVFPAALEFDIAMAGMVRTDGAVRAYSLTFDEYAEFVSAAPVRSATAPWCNYIQGVASVLSGTGRPVMGMDLVVAGTVPLASGLSSSAAMEVASCLAFEAAGGYSLDPVERALLGQRAEREFVGMNCGIMDQFISALGQADHALFIDTRDLSFESVPLPASGVSIVVGNTRKQRGLVDSKYNDRRRECETAVDMLAARLPGVSKLRDVSEEAFAAHAHILPDVVCRRARHVVTEDARVLRSVAALKAGDVAAFGKMMNQSHVSLRDDFEVSCAELDAMVEAAWRAPGVLGARMTGAGFGGCTVSLVRDECVAAFREQVGAEYAARTGLGSEFYVCRAASGARRVL